MAHTIDQLLALRVEDAMARSVVTVAASQTMSEVAQVLRAHEVSAAPVVDDVGCCVGVVTASDFVKREHDLWQRMPLAGEQPECLPATENQPYRLSSPMEDFAEYHMSTAVQSIDPAASLLKAARIMCAEHIHRLIVINELRQPVGVLSTMDIVAALVNVVDQQNEETARRRAGGAPR
jgi:CBS-domain-containing membrane protein